MRFIIVFLMGLFLAVPADAASKYHYIAQAILVLKKPTPAPTPTPAPSGECENCNGTGKLGDGTIFLPCPVCGGDGITANDTPELRVAADEAATLAPAVDRDATAGVPTSPAAFVAIPSPRRTLASNCAAGFCQPAAAVPKRYFPQSRSSQPRRLFSGRLLGRR